MFHNFLPSIHPLWKPITGVKWKCQKRKETLYDVGLSPNSYSHKISPQTEPHTEREGVEILRRIVERTFFVKIDITQRNKATSPPAPSLRCGKRETRSSFLPRIGSGDILRRCKTVFCSTSPRSTKTYLVASLFRISRCSLRDKVRTKGTHSGSMQSIWQIPL